MFHYHQCRALVTTEANTQMKMRVGSGDGTVTFKLLRANVTANSVTSGVKWTIDLRANAGSLGNSISVAGGATRRIDRCQSYRYNIRCHRWRLIIESG